MRLPALHDSVNVAMLVSFAFVGCGAAQATPAPQPNPQPVLRRESPGSPTASAGGDLDSFCADFATGLCGKSNGCSILASPRDSAICVAALTNSCKLRVSAPGTGFDRNGAHACLESIRNAPCGLEFMQRMDVACTFHGKLLTGATCWDSEQCQGYCKGSDRDTCGVCAPRGGAGNTCEGNGACTEGLACRNGKCTPRASVGGACTSDSDCARGATCEKHVCNVPAASGAACQGGLFSCKTGLACIDGTCARALGAGATCDPLDSACDFVTAGLECDLLSKTCKPRRWASGGESCGLVGGTMVYCPGSIGIETCEGVDMAKKDSFTGVCRPPAAIGETCDDAAGPKCATPAACVKGVCTQAAPTCK